MKRIGFIWSLVCALLGAMMVFVTGMVREIVPKISYMLFQASALGSTYSPDSYRMELTLPNLVAWALIAFGVVFGAYCFLTDQS